MTEVVWLDGWRSMWCWRLGDGLARPVRRSAVSATCHGFAHYKRGRFHAEFFADGNLYFQWGRRAAPWTEMTFQNDPLSATRRRFSVYRSGVLVQQFSYRRARIPSGRSGGFGPVEADRDWYVMTADRPSHWYERALSDYAQGWPAHG